MCQITCLNCGVVFEGIKSRKFCSHSCSAKYGNPGPRGPYKKNQEHPGCQKSYQELYNEARKIRFEEGYGYNIIANRLGLHEHTVMRWVKDIPAPLAHRKSSDLQIKSLSECRGKSKIREKLIQIRGQRCERCGLEEWLGQPIRIEVHHIDGNKKNNVLENLELLCPNCHAQTETYCSKNIKRGA